MAVGFLRRLDSNSNGMIDANEVPDSDTQKEMIAAVLKRLGIEAKYPISLSKIAQAAQNAVRASSDEEADSEGGSSEDASSSGSAQDSSAAQTKNGFGEAAAARPSVPGFGSPSGEKAKSVATSASPSSSGSSSASTPSKPAEASSSQSTSASSDPPPDSPKRTGPKSGRFLTPKERLAKGLPDWFLDKDADGDGQIGMAEFASRWTQDAAAEFDRYDLNHDGIITAAECLKAMSGSHHKSK
jgi:hypothetical protein